MTVALEFLSVSKTFKKRGKETRALNDISFSIAQGEAFGFVGPNGAGKSTTIKILLDIISDYQGTVQLYGKPARDALSRQGIAYVPESPALYDELTPLEILQMALRMYGIRRKDSLRWCQQWLDTFAIGHVAQRRIRQLSKGTVQRVALAHALVVSPRMLILDEPLSGLDPIGRKEVIEILARYKQEGGTLFFTSHVLYDVERIADRFGLINKGELITTREPRELFGEQSDRFTVRYQTPVTGAMGGAHLQKDIYEMELAQSQISDWLQSLSAQGGKLIDIRPSVSLEALFFYIIDQYENNASLPKQSSPQL